jgi:hypothetical protein
MKRILGEIGCKDMRWMKLAQDHVRKGLGPSVFNRIITLI